MSLLDFEIELQATLIHSRNKPKCKILQITGPYRSSGNFQSETRASRRDCSGRLAPTGDSSIRRRTRIQPA